ncbi:MAG: isoprenylcysteine carboxylmethyltransferase family protein [Planctomycetaceae bacterium]|jgi:protein-S-isoprenylcysteine O-methyltransferase Ste14|nr:isoprenylcysteine carboxylmethyltransferase family protein [Planctomycetaceae bacterium]
MTLKWIQATIIFPINAVIFIPAVLLFCTGSHYRIHTSISIPSIAGVAFISIPFVTGCVFFVCGVCLAGWTMRLFATQGEGTAAPWNPPKKLVVAGPYRYVRNPMITSVLLMLSGEALLLWSGVVFAWFAVFWLGNMIYFPLFEEKDLEKRFGESYQEYKYNVPRWIPRITPWNQTQIR